MAISVDILDLDMAKAEEYLRSQGCEIVSRDEMMLVYRWEGKEVTLYSQGKVMYLPQTVRADCIRDATALLEKLIENQKE